MVAARISYYCLNIPVLIIKEKHGLVWNPSFPLDLLEMLSLMCPAGEYFLYAVTMCKQYSLSIMFSKPKKKTCVAVRNVQEHKGAWDGGQLEVHRIGHIKFDGMHNQTHCTLGHC